MKDLYSSINQTSNRINQGKAWYHLSCENWFKLDTYYEYEIFRKDRKDGYGGVFIAVKGNLVYELVPRQHLWAGGGENHMQT